MKWLRAIRIGLGVYIMTLALGFTGDMWQYWVFVVGAIIAIPQATEGVE